MRILKVIIPFILLLFLVPSCTKIHREPSPPQVFGNKEVLRSLRDVQLRLERLRRQKEFARDKMVQAEQSLEQARELYRKGLYGEAYDMIIKANARMNAAKAAALLAVDDKSSAELEQELKSISGHMSDMEFEVNMEMTMGQARKAIAFVDGKISEIKKHVDALSDSLRQAENLLEFAKKHYQAGDYQKAFNLAIDAAEQAELVLPVEVLGGGEAVYQQAAKAGAKKHAGKKLSVYRVRKKDSLWKIAKRADVYGDPLLWPVLYKANQPRIKDPDIIQIGWELSIPRGGDLKRVAKKKRPAVRKTAKKKIARKRSGTLVPTPRAYRAPADKTAAKLKSTATSAKMLKIKVGAPVATATTIPVPTTAPTAVPVEEVVVAPPTPTPVPAAPTSTPASTLPSIEQLAAEAANATSIEEKTEEVAKPSAPPLPTDVEEVEADTGSEAEVIFEEEIESVNEEQSEVSAAEESDPELDALLGRLGEGSEAAEENSVEAEDSLEALMSQMDNSTEESVSDEEMTAEMDLESLLMEAGDAQGETTSQESLEQDNTDEDLPAIDFGNF